MTTPLTSHAMALHNGNNDDHIIEPDIENESTISTITIETITTTECARRSIRTRVRQRVMMNKIREISMVVNALRNIIKQQQMNLDILNERHYVYY